MSWDVPAFPGSPFRVRTANEAHLFVDVQGGEVVDSRIVDAEFQVLASVRGEPRVFGFRLDEPAPLEPWDLGEAPCTVLDPAELVLYAARVERELPEPPSDVRHHARRLRLAAAALREVVRLVGPSGSLPPDLFRSATGRVLAEDEPERFAPGHLLRESARLRTLADVWESLG